ncbi:MAG: patatin-like phospholipase family protein, partial [Nannocystaceae bacterium]
MSHDDTPPKVAFALSGGGSLGAVQVGMIRALYERGITPDLVIGTSAGAINASFIASHPATVATAEQLTEIWLSLSTFDVFPLRPVRATLALTGLRNYLVSSGALRSMIAEHLPIARIEDAPIPLIIIATDLMSGEEVELSSGPAVDAVLASSSIPGVFPPVRWGDRVLVDGGVSNNTPLMPAVLSGAERVYVLPTGMACGLRRPPRGSLGVLMQSLSLLVMQRLIVEVELYRERTELIVLPPPCPIETAPVDFGDSRELITRGREGTHRYLDRLDAGDVEAPMRLRLHSHY